MKKRLDADALVYLCSGLVVLYVGLTFSHVFESALVLIGLQIVLRLIHVEASLRELIATERTDLNRQRGD